MLLFVYNVVIAALFYGAFMKKKFLFLFIGLNYFVSTHADSKNLVSEDTDTLSEFTDIFDIEDAEQLEVHKHDAEEGEMDSLEEFAEKPAAPSQATILMRQAGLKVLIGYLAMRGYFENVWVSICSNAARFKSWVLREQID